jgi:hypothetical protein
MTEDEEPAGAPEEGEADPARIAVQSLIAHLESEGLAPWRDGAWTHLGATGLSCRVSAGGPTLRANRVLVPFWFEVALGDGTDDVVVETLAGMGATVAEAATFAAHDLVATVLPVIRTIVEPGYTHDGVRELDLVSRDDETGETTAWRAFAGPPLVLGEAGDALRAALDAQPPLGLLLNTLTGFLHLRQRHWMKAFLLRGAAGVDGEVRVDNEVMADGLTALKAFRWPAVPAGGILSFRQFLMVEPAPDGVAPPPDLLATLEAARPAAPKPAPRRWWRFGR